MKPQHTKMICAAGAALVLLSPLAIAGTARVCFEAGKPVSLQSPLRIVKSSEPQVSGGHYLDIPWDLNKTKGIGAAIYKVNAKSAGLYYLWARTYWTSGCGNSIYVSVNGGNNIILGQDGQHDAWHWVGGATRVTLKAGVNTIAIKNRETGVRVNQVFLTEDAEYTPQGIRKDT